MISRTTMERANPIASVYDPKKGTQLSIELNRWILKPIGVWPKSVHLSWMGKFVYLLINVICITFVCFLLLPAAINVELDKEEFTYRMLRLSSIRGFSIMTIIKYLSLIFRENDIRNGIQHIEIDWMNTQRYEDRIIMIKNAKFGRRIVTIVAFVTYGSAFFYYIALPLNSIMMTKNDENLTFQLQMNPAATETIDKKYNFNDIFFFWMQLVSGFIAHSVYAGTLSLAAVFAVHAYSRLEVLMQWIQHLVDGREDLCDNVDERLMTIVQQHVRIIRFISLTDKVLREISFLDITCSTLIMILLGYFCIKEWETREITNYLTFIVLLMCMTFNIFVLCYIGDIVTDRCKKIGEVSYMTDWYRLPERKNLALVLMIAMSNASIKLTAGIFELSLSTFGEVIKVSLAYLNVLRTVMT
ncbi:uncharacterized protein LOC105195332 [Solenopsis invicta]|uniref:uncharacterized protein LOC105195332 n=1 Tax=Solenopsis invicta TaxID=13686 RepID=UPI000E33DF51|nr:uncharacterized protein LOC105195332 [Solenopsis invicta]